VSAPATKPNPFVIRLIGSVAVAAPTVLIALFGEPLFTVSMALVVLIGARELNTLLCGAGYQSSVRVTALTALAVFAGVRFPELPLLLPALSLVLMGSFALQLRHARDQRVGDWAVSFAGGLYLGWTGGHLAELRVLPDGLWWLALAIGATWATDSGAYLIGRALGKHKLAPAISPGKTWEGYFGGLIAGGLTGAAIGAASPPGLLAGALAGTLVGALSVFGDLIESMIKRQANAKDSGHLIPGHGGVLDRIDSLLWSGVIVFYIAQYMPRL
jgi:phosphatidate cytidylyltransferase